MSPLAIICSRLPTLWLQIIHFASQKLIWLLFHEIVAPFDIYFIFNQFSIYMPFWQTLTIVEWVLSGILGLIVYITQFHNFTLRFCHFWHFVHFLPIFNLNAILANSHHPRMDFEWDFGVLWVRIVYNIWFGLIFAFHLIFDANCLQYPIRLNI